MRKNGLLDIVGDEPIPNGAWLKGRGARSQVLDTTPPHPVTSTPGLASQRGELPGFVPTMRTIHPIGTRTIWANGYVGIKTAEGTKKSTRS